MISNVLQDLHLKSSRAPRLTTSPQTTSTEKQSINSVLQNTVNPQEAAEYSCSMTRDTRPYAVTRVTTAVPSRVQD
jgi:hypothetical protein